MQVLNIILAIATVAANAALTFFAGYAFVTLRSLRRDAAGMRRAVAMTLTLTMGSHVKGNFDDVRRMQARLHELVQTERYEEAEEMKALIDRASRAAVASLERFKELCGDEAADAILAGTWKEEQ